MYFEFDLDIAKEFRITGDFVFFDLRNQFFNLSNLRVEL